MPLGREGLHCSCKKTRRQTAGLRPEHLNQRHMHLLRSRTRVPGGSRVDTPLPAPIVGPERPPTAPLPVCDCLGRLTFSPRFGKETWEGVRTPEGRTTTAAVTADSSPLLNQVAEGREVEAIRPGQGPGLQITVPRPVGPSPRLVDPALVRHTSRPILSLLAPRTEGLRRQENYVRPIHHISPQEGTTLSKVLH